MSHEGQLQRLSDRREIVEPNRVPDQGFQRAWQEIVEHLEAVIESDEGKQPLDATLTAWAAYNTNGLLTQTAADTFTGRTITGTAAEITVTNGSGVAGNPTLSLPTALTFTGKTVTGGTFTAITDIAIADGGTGASTAANALTNLGIGGIETAWTTYSPTALAGVGTFTTVAATGRWKQVGKTVHVRIKVTITTNGTAATFFTVTAPTASNNVDAAFFQSLSCIRTAGGDDAGRAALQNNSTTIFVQKYDGTYLGGSGAVIIITGTYEAA